MRTLTFGDRTISYDLGLDVMEDAGPQLNIQPEMFQPTERKVSLAFSDDSGVGSECSEDHEDVDTERKLIKPDIKAISQLLNFDEEEEDDLSDSETDDINNCDSVNLIPCSTKKDNVSTSCSNDKESVLEANFVPPDESIISLSLSELCHIRSELAKAELEALSLDESVRLSIEQGRICYVCTNTRFGMFRRGEKCEVCQKRVCSKCFSRMRIPAEQCIAIPVQVMNPKADQKSSATTQSMMVLDVSNNLQVNKTDAPKTLCAAQLPQYQIHSLPALSSYPRTPLSLPMNTFKYNTLPSISGRLWSMISSRETDRERPEGSVCTQCKDMVKEVTSHNGEWMRDAKLRWGVDDME